QHPLAWHEEEDGSSASPSASASASALPGGAPGGQSDEPTQQHIHTVIRTPNGNDYGVDLLKLHLATDH
ncbi:DUF3500 domain-containing protein, partial [Streptomyces sp. TRM76130]|nr:DUF3500 domain-containing protein [Streptomyces sp. TRM76130]